MKKQTIGIIEIIVASVLFGFVPILVRFGSGIGAYNLSFFRVLIATASLGLLFVFGRKYFKLAPFKYEKGKLLLFGAIHGFIILGYFFAIQFLSVSSAVLLLYSSAIWIVVFSYFILKEKITGLTLLALIVAFIGVILIVSPNDFFVRNNFIGSLAGLLSGVGFGLVYVLSKTFKKYDKVSLTFWQNLIALPFLLGLIFINLPSFSVGDVGLLLILGIFCTTIPFILVFKGFSKVKGQTGGVVILLDILIPVMFAFLFFKEIPTISVIIGGIMLIIGTYLATKSQ